MKCDLMLSLIVSAAVLLLTRRATTRQRQQRSSNGWVVCFYASFVMARSFLASPRRLAGRGRADICFFKRLFDKLLIEWTS